MLTIVTGASQNHSKSLKQFLGTLKNIQIPFQCYVYDLGLEDIFIKDIKDLYPSFIYRKFDYTKYPEYFNINIDAGYYAWKPIIIEEVSKEVDGIMIWCDAGNKIIESLEKLYKIIEDQEIYSAVSLYDIQRMTYPSVLKLFGIENNTDFLRLQNRNAACMGFDTRKENVRKFLSEFSYFAYKKEYIAPEGHNKVNHRWDQSIFTVLYYRFFKNIFTVNEYISYTIHNDID